MSDLDGLIATFDYIEKYTTAVITGTQKFISFLPIMINQHIETLAQQRLTTTRERFTNAISTKTEGGLLVITVDPEDWLAISVESGADPFDMKTKALKSPKAKISKEGFKYMVIPISQSKSAKGSSTEKGQDFQAMITKELTKPKFKLPKMKLGIDGTLSMMEEVIANDPRAKGMYRVKTFKSAKDMASGGRPVRSGYVMFRVMSEKFPEKWQHPGIKPANIFKDTETWIYQMLPGTFKQFLDNEIRSI